MSLSHVAAQYGMDTEELLAQIARDRQLAEQFGIKYALEPFGVAKKAAVEVIEDDE